MGTYANCVEWMKRNTLRWFGDLERNGEESVCE